MKNLNQLLKLEFMFQGNDESVKDYWQVCKFHLLYPRDHRPRFKVSSDSLRAKNVDYEESDFSLEEIDDLIRRFPNDTTFIRERGGKERMLYLPGNNTNSIAKTIAFGLEMQDYDAVAENLAHAMWRLHVPPIYGGARLTAYMAWQTCNDQNIYANRYGTTDGFKMKPFGPPPVDFAVLDTSSNPGHESRIGSIPVTVSSDLWLGPHFWDYAPCTKEEVLAADFFLEKRDTPHFLYLKSWPHPFTRPDGEQGRVQQKLWRLLFHEDCEWPPGSGRISDVPVGGPPELMP